MDRRGSGSPRAQLSKRTLLAECTARLAAINPLCRVVAVVLPLGEGEAFELEQPPAHGPGSSRVRREQTELCTTQQTDTG